MHGHVFQVIARGQGVLDSSQKYPEPVNPTYRDTISVPAESYIVIRFRANNPGVWFFHCHVDWHVPAGLAATFITAPQLALEKMELPQSLIDICEASGQPTSGNAAGKEGLDLDGAPDGIRPLQQKFVMGGLVATLVGISTIIWHVWVDPGHEEEEDDDNDNERRRADKQPLLSKSRKD